MSDLQTTIMPLSRKRQSLVILALSVGAFALGVGEFASMGLMLDMSRGLNVTEPQIGATISAYALGVMIGAPLLAFVGANLKRKPLLLLLALLYALANAASALAPTYESLIVARFFSGLPHGTYFGIATLLAASVSPPSQKGAAVSKVMLGLSVAILLGNPLAVWLGQHTSWRAAFAFVGALSILTVLMVNWSVPANPNEQKSSLSRELSAFNRGEIWLALVMGFFGFAGMFTVFSYLAPIMVNVTGVSESWMPWMVVLFGIGSIVGMIGGGRIADRMKFKGIGLILLWSIVVSLIFPFAATSLEGVAVATVAVGTMMAMPVAMQAHFMNIAGDAQVLSAASNQAALNASNALGPWLGGMAINGGLGYNFLGPIGAVTSILGLILWLIIFLMSKRTVPV
ncbi:MFS transporter [Pectobacterium polonicum]|uniref:MFS transporter n=2 Tax=Pectobacterium polonicum TaxID=2485124 RepID=A0AAE9NQK9_9GAMM|nr:MFS transporter [Pectobacterium polonicum]UVO07915.1 MFS transporter [Pectobacterium polonicum]